MQSGNSPHPTARQAAAGPLSSGEIRSRFLRFFEKRGHTVIPSASLVTPDEKGVTNATLFNTAGMQPLIPYLLGKPYIADDQSGNPASQSPRQIKRLVDAQKCLRTVDIDDIGDNTHATFFEMLGNWSLGDYFKKEAIAWSYEFLTSTSDAEGDRGLGLDKNRLYVTVFAGDANSGKDTESAAIWKNVGVPEHRIYFKDAASNWWPAVKGNDDSWTGPTGPCSEMFYDITADGLGDLTPEQFEKADNEQKVVEIWNDVFMEFEKKDGLILGKLSQKNVDTGAGLERLTAVLQDVNNIYDTDLLKPVMEMIKASSKNFEIKSARIVADHVRASVFLIADGVIPSNTDRGYVLRRLLRGVFVNLNKLSAPDKMVLDLVKIFVDQYAEIYNEISATRIAYDINKEEARFKFSIMHGKQELEKIKLVQDRLRQLAKEKDDKNKKLPLAHAHRADFGSSHHDSINQISGKEVFDLYQNFGFPPELINEELAQYGMSWNRVEFEEEMEKHQALSRAGSEQKFKGGLADANDPMVVRYHTATHLLHQALHDVLGEGVGQKGSNITAERLRFDFSYPTKMTDEQKRKVEEIVNEKIVAALPMNNVVMPRAEAEKTGARHFFGEKYGEQISIYYIGTDLATAYSKEFCGGPHVKNTRELAGPEGKWRFKIGKEEAVSAGVRRIKAVLS